MRWKQGAALLVSIGLAACFAIPVFSASAQTPIEPHRKERALLIGIDDFVSKPDTYPSSINNVYAMQEIFQAAYSPLEALIIPGEPMVSPGELTALIQETFADAKPEDVSYLYISTHGEYSPGSGEEPALLLSDGEKESRMTASELEAAFDGIEGTKVLILDACNSGAFIGKGEPNWEAPACFLGEDFKVLTSSGALEESWYWNAEPLPEEAVHSDSFSSFFSLPEGQEAPTPQGAFYFTQEILQGLSPRYGYAADRNKDGNITLTELYEQLLQSHSASTPQVYPQQDDFVIFRYDTNAPLPQGMRRAPILDVTFSGTVLSEANRSVTLEYIATRPVQVGYQIVYQRDGKWDFDGAKILFDNVERFAAYGDREGAVSAGHKMRTLALDIEGLEAYGYLMVQLVSIDQGKVTVHAGQVFCVPPPTGDLQLAVDVKSEYRRKEDRELGIYVLHAYPCALSVAVLNETGEIVRRISHGRSTRPSQTDPPGSLFYWDGMDKHGHPVPDGVYQIRATGELNDVMFTAISSPITIQ